MIEKSFWKTGIHQQWWKVERSYAPTPSLAQKIFKSAKKNYLGEVLFYASVVLMCFAVTVIALITAPFSWLFPEPDDAWIDEQEEPS